LNRLFSRRLHPLLAIHHYRQRVTQKNSQHQKNRRTIFHSLPLFLPLRIYITSYSEDCFKNRAAAPACNGFIKRRNQLRYFEEYNDETISYYKACKNQNDIVAGKTRAAR
jgi:hypothetical protein